MLAARAPVATSDNLHRKESNLTRTSSALRNRSAISFYTCKLYMVLLCMQTGHGAPVQVGAVKLTHRLPHPRE